MKLYAVYFKRATYYVEAANYAEAIEAWRNSDQLVGDDREMVEPDSVNLVSNDPVIRPRKTEGEERT